MYQISRYLQRRYGVALFGFGLLGDCLLCSQFILHGNRLLLLWHIPLVVLWAVGVNCLSDREEQSASHISFTRWGLTALLLGLGTFPGFGSGAYSLAFFIVRYFLGSPALSRQVALSELQTAQLSAVAPSSPGDAQFLREELYTGDTEARRVVVAKISRSVHPDSTRLLRQLLSDPLAEIRSDASIALTRLDEEISRPLGAAFEAWRADPGNPQLSLALAEQYYRYAVSDVLEKQSQRFYLLQAQALLLQMRAGAHGSHAHMETRLAADIRQRLDELSEVSYG